LLAAPSAGAAPVRSNSQYSAHRANESIAKCSKFGLKAERPMFS
jgi:hypothetical protein